MITCTVESVANNYRGVNPCFPTHMMDDYNVTTLIRDIILDYIYPTDIFPLCYIQFCNY